MTPNILVVVLDTARADAVEPYSRAAGRTPAVAELARRGSALPHAYATASWTLPSHASLFSGLLPRALGLGQAPGGTPQSARPVLEALADRLLPEVLRRSGYRTQCVTTNLWVSQHAGFDIGFDDFEFLNRSRQALLDAGEGLNAGARLRWTREALRAETDDGAAEAGRVLRAWIGDWSGTPTFWFVNLIECHSPYLPPRPWNDLPPWDRLRAAREARRHLSFEAICRTCAGPFDVPDGALERMRHLYGRAVGYMDRWLADVLAALDQKGILEETLVIVTSDHGENFGENGLLAHAFSIDERLIHVPLVMAGPGAIQSEQAVSLAALPRMIAAAAGIEDHPWPAEELPQGVAVAQFDPLAGPDDQRIKAVVEEWGFGREGIERMTPTIVAATDGRQKLSIRNGSELLYDLDADPLEEAPGSPFGGRLRPPPNGVLAGPSARKQAAGAGGSLAVLRAALEHPAATARAPAPSPAGAEPAPEELDRLERQMKLLGYM
jgi:arylsulfatase A-like enzyme